MIHRELESPFAVIEGSHQAADVPTIGSFLEAVLDDLDTSERVKQLRALPYAEYLKSDHWKMTRRLVLEMFAYRCGRCSSTTQLNVHHQTYERLGAEELSDLEVLCRRCHADHHGIAEPALQTTGAA